MRSSFRSVNRRRVKNGLFGAGGRRSVNPVRGPADERWRRSSRASSLCPTCERRRRRAAVPRFARVVFPLTNPARRPAVRVRLRLLERLHLHAERGLRRAASRPALLWRGCDREAQQMARGVWRATTTLTMRHTSFGWARGAARHDDAARQIRYLSTCDDDTAPHVYEVGLRRRRVAHTMDSLRTNAATLDQRAPRPTVATATHGVGSRTRTGLARCARRATSHAPRRSSSASRRSRSRASQS